MKTFFGRQALFTRQKRTQTSCCHGDVERVSCSEQLTKICRCRGSFRGFLRQRLKIQGKRSRGEHLLHIGMGKMRGVEARYEN